MYFLLEKRYPKQQWHIHGGWGSSIIVKVPGDEPPARVCFFKRSSLVKGILLANFRPFSLGKGMLFGNFCQIDVKLR